MSTPLVQELIGPLTVEEWASLRFTGADDDLLYCCGNTSEVRDALFAVLRMGGGKEYGASLRAVWHLVEQHDGLFEHPLMRKLYDFYVAGEEPGPSDAEMAEFLTMDPGTAEKMLAAAPDAWNLNDPAEVRTALGRLAGKMYATPDRELREGYIRSIAGLTGFPESLVRLVFDAFRGSVNLPIEEVS